jgi:hypothetical protein
LSLEGITTPGKRMILGYDTNSNGFGFIKAGYFGVAWTALSLQPDGGNVGIGTTGPAEKLAVVGNIRSAGNVIASVGLGYGNYVSMRHDDVNGYITITRTVNAGHLILQPYGNVGINTTSPATKLEVYGGHSDTTARLYSIGNGSGSDASLDMWASEPGVTYDGSGIGNNVNGHPYYGRRNAGIAQSYIRFYNGGILLNTGSTTASQTVTVLASGNVGIATTNPLAQLHVANTMRVGVGFNDPATVIFGDSGTPYWTIGRPASSGNFRISSYAVNALEIQPTTGYVGIGTTGPSYKLDVVGDARITSGSLGVGVAPNATDGRIDASNDIVAFQTSDRRLKENITPITNALEKVKSLTGVMFDWKEETKSVHGYEGHDVGIIAQDVQAVLPEAVRTNDTGYLSVRYEKMIALLIEGMKEQQLQIDELKSKLK